MDPARIKLAGAIHTDRGVIPHILNSDLTATSISTTRSYTTPGFPRLRSTRCAASDPLVPKVPFSTLFPRDNPLAIDRFA
ncbi:hypothetical protein BC628DRAFT_118544 [Trametes gibbosa]|nr:hypothetical protein BC628DRAFT_118544 [Trametes gibbosa]